MISLLKDVFKLLDHFLSELIYSAFKVIALAGAILIGLVFYLSLYLGEEIGVPFVDIIVVAALDFHKSTPVVSYDAQVLEAKAAVGEFKAKFYPVIKTSDNEKRFLGIIAADALNDQANLNASVQDVFTPSNRIFPLLHLFLKYNGLTALFGILFFFALTNYFIYARLNRLVLAINAYKSLKHTEK